MNDFVSSVVQQSCSVLFVGNCGRAGLSLSVMSRRRYSAYLCASACLLGVQLQINVICSDRGLVSQRVEELENPLLKRFLVGFARTSESNGPAVPPPLSAPIEESQVRARLIQPLFGIPFRIFGSAPPLQSFDFAKMLTVSLMSAMHATTFKHWALQHCFLRVVLSVLLRDVEA